MKVVILAGGLGSRLSEYTKIIPKPMVKILKVPILVRIINFYKKFGYKDFLIASGYKSEIIENYFNHINHDSIHYSRRIDNLILIIGIILFNYY